VLVLEKARYVLLQLLGKSSTKKGPKWKENKVHAFIIQVNLCYVHLSLSLSLSLSKIDRLSSTSSNSDRSTDGELSTFFQA
jgi:hypothetical protein